jgi:multicomponent Na+:H+ antiporter subunit C
MADGVLEIIVSRINYWVYIALMMIGLYGIIGKNNIMKKIIGLSILQTAVILFFVSIGAKRDATIPIIDHTLTTRMPLLTLQSAPPISSTHCPMY